MTTSSVEPPMESLLDEGLRQPPQQRQRKHSSPPRHQQQHSYAPYRPEDELDFVVHQPRPLLQKHNRPPQVSRAVLGVRRMSSVPELGQSQRGPGGRPGRSHHRQRSNSNIKAWDANGRIPYEAGQGGNRLIRQKSMERGIVGLPSRPSPQGKRIIKGGGGSRPGSRPGSRTGSRPGSRNDVHPPHPSMPQNRPPPPPGLKMPLAFSNISRERGFTTGSHSAASQPHQALAHGRSQHRISPPGLPTNLASSAPDLFENRQHHNNFHRPFHREPLRSHPYHPQPPFSTANSVNNSPHSSFGPPPGNAEEIQALFRSALSTSDLNRSSSFTTTSETLTESSNAMTVDEAIGMYGSDTDEDDMYASGMESEYRRSKGDSVLGGPTYSDGGYAYRTRGDSALEGDTSSDVRSRYSAQEDRLQEELDMQEGNDLLNAQQPVNVDPTIHHPPGESAEPNEPSVAEAPDATGASGEINEEMILSSVPVSDTVRPSPEEPGLPMEDVPDKSEPPPPIEPRDRYG